MRYNFLFAPVNKQIEGMFLPGMAAQKRITPLPTQQMLMICVVSVIEPLQFGIVFPIMYFLGIFDLTLFRYPINNR
jgi:hypothetical protein